MTKIWIFTHNICQTLSYHIQSIVIYSRYLLKIFFLIITHSSRNNLLFSLWLKNAAKFQWSMPLNENRKEILTSVWCSVYVADLILIWPSVEKYLKQVFSCTYYSIRLQDFDMTCICQVPASSSFIKIYFLEYCITRHTLKYFSSRLKQMLNGNWIGIMFTMMLLLTIYLRWKFLWKWLTAQSRLTIFAKRSTTYFN